MPRASRSGSVIAPDDGAGHGKQSPAGPFPIVGVGASAGGLEAFSDLLKHLRLDTGMGFVLVQHLDPQHESELAKLLARTTSLPVREASNNLRVRPDHVYVIPRDANLGISGGVLKLRRRPESRAPSRAIDSFLEELAADQGERAIGVILSGTATDGTLGLEAIKAAGGFTFAQDDSARYNSMPRSAVAAGCVDLVLSPDRIAKELARIAKHPHVAAGPARPRARARDAPTTSRARRGSALGGRSAPGANAVHAGAGRPARMPVEGLRTILLLLRNHREVDFSLYKPSTIQRRIHRRMVLNKQDTLEGYARFLRGNTKELEALYSDLLIGVTSFFRDPDAFDALQRKVLPGLLKRRGDQPVRVWVLGCSTGQEAYSIAMALVEAGEKAPRMPGIQLFATDVNGALLDKARQGLYARSIVRDVTPERLRRFFVEEDGGYRVSKRLREMVVFARQNLISDPPFSRMDLISCRNLLIYLEPGLQKRLIPVFHYALKPGGFLFLGSSESTGSFTQLFEQVDKKHRIYARKPAATPALRLPRSGHDWQPPPGQRRKPTDLPLFGGGALGDPAEGSRDELNAQREADRVSISRFAPPGVLVDADLRILQFRGATDPYLRAPAGKASFDLLKMARAEVVLPLRAAIRTAKKHDKPARRDGVRIDADGATRTMSLEVVPLRTAHRRCFLVLFEDDRRAGRAARAARKARGTPLSGRPARTDHGRAAGAGRPSRRAELRRIDELEAELAETREYLQSLQEQHDTSNEEFQAWSEEVQSANEELQSINEELETSREELESTNEELTTLNEEMANRNVELSRLNSDLVNIQSSAELVILLLGRDLTIRRFSPKAERQFGLLAADVGRSFRHIPHDLCVDDLDRIMTEVIETVSPRELVVQDRSGRWYSLRLRPYVTLDGKVEGVVLALLDIDHLKRSEEAMRAARDDAESIIQTVREPMVVLDAELRVENANGAFYRFFQVTPAETTGRMLYDLGTRQWDIPGLRALLEGILTENATVEDYKVEHDFERIGRRMMLVSARRMHDPDRRSGRILLALEDITERQKHENALSEADAHKDEFLATLAHELRGPLAPIRSALEIIRRAPGIESPGPGLAAAPDRELVGGGSTTVATESMVELMERQVDHLTRLVEDLLDVARISRGRIVLRKERFDLCTVVRRAADDAGALAGARGHQLTVELPSEPLYVTADAIRLAQIVGNLLNNARRFTDEGGRIWLTVEKSGSTSDVVIRVRDTGVGIPPDQLSGIFGMFTQAGSSQDRSQRGLGIGLALVRKLAELHGGSVEAHSAGAGQGSEFVVRLPIAAENAPSSPELPAGAIRSEPAPAAGLKILVVDDNRDTADSLAMLLRLSGHRTQIAHDGLEAVEAAASFRPDVVLMDIGLPKVDGYEAARRIRMQPDGGSPMLVALTGWGQEDDIRRTHEAGFDAHVVKPAEPDDLLRLLAGPRPKRRD